MHKTFKKLEAKLRQEWPTHKKICVRTANGQDNTVAVFQEVEKIHISVKGFWQDTSKLAEDQWDGFCVSINFILTTNNEYKNSNKPINIYNNISKESSILQFY